LALLCLEVRPRRPLAVHQQQTVTSVFSFQDAGNVEPPGAADLSEDVIEAA
jgi:hypothetical protein